MTESFIDVMVKVIREQHPGHAPLFESYAQEARFGREWIAGELAKLSSGDEILEIGGGMMLLACQLAKEGYNITALEPVGSGFGHFYELQKLVLSHAASHGITLKVLPSKGEDLQEENRYSLVYSINVMEHVENYKAVLRRSMASLKKGGVLRFVCPNYTFPLESHLGLPIVWNKAITWKLFKNLIEHSPVPDAMGVWESLNFITVKKVQQYCRSGLGLTADFDTRIIYRYVNRAANDEAFKSRHNAFVCWVLATVMKWKLLGWLHLVPARIMPVMDCRLLKA